MPYTVAIREKGKTGSWSYVDQSLQVHDVAHYCKPLTLAQAKSAKQMLIDGATKLNRPIDARVVILAKGHTP